MDVKPPPLPAAGFCQKEDLIAEEMGTNKKCN